MIIFKPLSKWHFQSGYSYKRLMTKHDFGVFECNAGCRCGPRCLNRVVGNGVRAQLQAFATRRKGWGVRALHFIPRGSFVCVYHGQILTDDQANLVAKDYYLAALDHIEVAVESAGDSARRGGGSRVDPEEVKQNRKLVLWLQKFCSHLSLLCCCSAPKPTQ